MQGIYGIINKINGKIYVGKAENIEIRWKRHIRDLNKKQHHNPPLERTWAKYGEENFEFKILEEVSDIKLLEIREDFWQKITKSLDSRFGYNLREAGNRGAFTEEAKHKISQKRKGMKFSEEHKKHIGEHSKKKWQNPEFRKKMSIALNKNTLGRRHTEKAKQKMSLAQKGHKLTEEQRKKISRIQEKLTDTQVIEILERIHNRESVASVAKDYPRGIIERIIYNKAYKHIDRDAYNLKPVRASANVGTSNTNAKITEKEVLIVKERLEQGLSMLKIAKETNVSYGTIRKIKDGTGWKHVTNGKIKETNKICRTTLDEKQKIEQMLKEGYNMQYISKALNVTYGAVRSIKRKETNLN